MRYNLKKKYFNEVPANLVRTTSPVSCMTDDQWKLLVEMWSTSKHKDTCMKNKISREQVKFPQGTGSQSYIAKAYSLVDMESMAATPVEDGNHSKSSTEVVSQVLPKSSLFLQNVGLATSNRSSSGNVSAKV
ncbi:uncharacterized protein [Zea mays]|uniref:uncharacterized protein n=1 Tax=Zea mays TaxID=4577 RepID=UPI0009AAD54A|nr:uncharacterized protein LOC103645250 [Zea mays]|eukprot:XP_020398969.1 uncharacterized protein LOC103645250 [Zea mays]